MRLLGKQRDPRRRTVALRLPQTPDVCVMPIRLGHQVGDAIAWLDAIPELLASITRSR
jgi:hypothetical protein